MCRKNLIHIHDYKTAVYTNSGLQTDATWNRFGSHMSDNNDRGGATVVSCMTFIVMQIIGKDHDCYNLMSKSAVAITIPATVTSMAMCWYCTCVF